MRIKPFKNHLIKTREWAEKKLEEVYNEWEVSILPKNEEEEWIRSQMGDYFYTPPSWNNSIPYKLKTNEL